MFTKDYKINITIDKDGKKKIEKIKVKNKEYKRKKYNRKSPRDISTINKARVLGAVIKQPLLQKRDIAKKLNLSLPTITNHLNTMKDIKKSGIITKICSQDINIVEKANILRMEYLDQVSNKVIRNKQIQEGIIDGEIIPISNSEIAEIDKISATSHKRYTILAGDMTNEDGGLNNNFNNIPTDKLLQIYTDDIQDAID